MTGARLGLAASTLVCLAIAGCASAPAEVPTRPRLDADPPRAAARPDAEEAAARIMAGAPAPAAELALASAPAGRASPSCEGHPLCQGESCCTSIVVPAGRHRDDLAGEVHVASFALDKYELTVGRVLAWARAGSPVPADGAPIGRDASGRTISWRASYRVQTGEALAGWERYDTWRTGKATLPKNFLDWYTAAAVCAMDGGRLPNDAEWRHAAVGGEEDRTYPWGSAPQTPERAIFNCMGDGDASCSLADIVEVGSRPAGAGRWGHQDLAGSMFEWTLDAAGSDVAMNRGGGFCYIGGLDRRNTAVRTAANARRDEPSTVSHMVGARCAYDLPAPAVAAVSR